MRVLIIGVNGFIGNALVERVLAETDWSVAGMDLRSDRLGDLASHERFHFVQGDITKDRNWIDEQVAASDVVLPLVAIATPALYVRDPLRVFELDFEENLRIVRQCVRRRKRLLFPSSSEVYGMSTDPEFFEDRTAFVLGPICKTRWIYSCAKQMLDRVIHAYGEKDGLRYTLFRPFNWIGPKLDDVYSAKIGSSRVVTQFIVNLLQGDPIYLVDGGAQRRCFTWIDDGITALMAILRDDGRSTDRQIFNIGNPENECSIKDLAEMLCGLYRGLCPERSAERPARVVNVSGDEYYGQGYQDLIFRRPNIDKARGILGWEPRVPLDESMRRTFEAVLAAEGSSRSG
jgi:nucleoside-diphosphate-sugar epimerase